MAVSENAQEKISRWVMAAENAARAANELRNLTSEMQNEFVATYEEVRRNFEYALKEKNDEIERLKNSSENDRSVATQEEMVNILRSFLDEAEDDEKLHARLKSFVEFLQDHRGEYMNPTQISLALVFA
ncbi:MAG: hypothetical protein Q7S84_04860 [bacterium]|nr:hypothetical protein [bacterium]